MNTREYEVDTGKVGAIYHVSLFQVREGICVPVDVSHPAFEVHVGCLMCELYTTNLCRASLNTCTIHQRDVGRAYCCS